MSYELIYTIPDQTGGRKSTIATATVITAKGEDDSIGIAIGTALDALLKARSYFPQIMRENFMRTFFAWKEEQFPIGDQTVGGLAMFVGSDSGGTIYDSTNEAFLDKRGYLIDQDIGTNLNTYGAAIIIGTNLMPATLSRYMNEESREIKQTLVVLLDYAKKYYLTAT